MRGAAHQALRDGTAAAHEAVDAAFGGFDLGDAAGYRRFLHAHAAALIPVERALDEAGMDRLLPDWAARRRAPALLEDLRVLGEPVPDADAFSLAAGDPAAWGAAYVLEGSRLGGALLARGVPPGLPRAYLAAPQPPGAWRKLLVNLDDALYLAGMRAAAIRSALSVFDRFRQAAG